MSNTITLQEPTVDTLISSWTGLELWHASTQLGVYALLVQIPYVAHQTTYTYVDGPGLASDWYECRRYGPGPTYGSYSAVWGVTAAPLPVIPSSAIGLIQELGARMGDYTDGQVTLLGTDTQHLVDATRIEPDNTLRLGWLTYTGTLASANTGLERRITSYDGTIVPGQIGLGNGSPGSGLAAVAQVGDAYEIHMRWSRKRKLAAINQAIRRLPQDFWRRIIDTSITTIAQTAKYPLPAGITTVLDVQIQNSLTFASFPYARLRGWSVDTGISTTGVPTRTLQFDMPLPTGRILRIFGTGYQPILTLDSDVIQVGQDDYDQRLYEYVLGYAECQLWLWGANGSPVDQAARPIEMVKLDLQMVEEMKPGLVMPNEAMEIRTPATSEGVVGRNGWGDDPRYFGALHSP